jgi:hypothetical protein
MYDPSITIVPGSHKPTGLTGTHNNQANTLVNDHPDYVNTLPERHTGETPFLHLLFNSSTYST